MDWFNRVSVDWLMGFQLVSWGFSWVGSWGFSWLVHGVVVGWFGSVRLVDGFQ